jgi:small-conductance mechanosensitive channel
MGLAQEGTSSDADQGAVRFNGEVVFEITEPLGPISVRSRVEEAQESILEVANRLRVSVDEIRSEMKDGVIYIIAGTELITEIIPADAEAANLTQQQLAQNQVSSIQQAIREYRQERSPQRLIRGGVLAFVTTIIFLLALIFLNRLRPRLLQRLNRLNQNGYLALRFQKMELISSETLHKILTSTLKITYITLVCILFYVYSIALLELFPWTERYGELLISYIIAALLPLTDAILNYLPNLLIILPSLVLTYFALRLCNLTSQAIKDGEINLPGFYPEWAKPTALILKAMILFLAGAVVIPLLPGFGSPAFQGISVFLGLLVSIGSSSAIANLISGIILMYTRAFQQGDRIRVGEATGDVVEQTLLATRIRTINNVLVTIPNALILSSKIDNYSASAREQATPLILHTSVTLGYDAPWRQVHEALIKAASATSYILKDPQPFVLQTSLNDFYVTYEVKAYSRYPQKMALIYSELHQNIQDCCNEAGIEILSPHYTGLRDGNTTTIPQSYLSPSYVPPGFRIQAWRLTGHPDDPNLDGQTK